MGGIISQVFKLDIYYMLVSFIAPEEYEHSVKLRVLLYNIYTVCIKSHMNIYYIRGILTWHWMVSNNLQFHGKE